MVFEDVVFDDNSFDIDVTIQTIYNRVTQLLLSNTTSSNTTSLNSRVPRGDQEYRENGNLYYFCLFFYFLFMLILSSGPPWPVCLLDQV